MTFSLLRTRNKVVSAAGPTLARLTMMIEMARLYSRFGHWAGGVAIAMGARPAESGSKANWMFSDVLRQFSAATVAKRRQCAKRWIGALAVLAFAGCATVAGPGTSDQGFPARSETRGRRGPCRGAVGGADQGRRDRGLRVPQPRHSRDNAVDVYKAKHKVGIYRQIKVDSVDCEGAVCTVKLTLSYDYSASRASRRRSLKHG